MAFTLNRQALSSLFFIAVGGGFAAISWLHHPLGTAASMGRGFFPFWVGLTLAVLGAVALVRSQVVMDQEEASVTIALRPLACVIGAVVAFALLLPEGGLYVASLAGVLIASRADREFGAGRALLLGLGLAVAAHLAFILGLGLPIPAWPSFIAG